MEGGDHSQNDELYPIAVLIDELKVCCALAGHSTAVDDVF